MFSHESLHDRSDLSYGLFEAPRLETRELWNSIVTCGPRTSQLKMCSMLIYANTF